MTVNLPYGPPMNTDNGYDRAFLANLFCKCCDVSCAIFVGKSQCLPYNAKHQVR